MKVRKLETLYKVFQTKPVCPYCGEEYPLHVRELKAMEEIELKKITEAEAKAEQERKEQLKIDIRNARNAADFFAIAKKNGYSQGWAYRRARMRGYM